MHSTAQNLDFLKRSVPQGVRVVAVSKTKPPSAIMEAYDAGHRLFGENRVQELLGKKDHLPGDIEWHLIGHLQSNKVKYIAPFISMIESVDSYRLLTVIDRESRKAGRVTDCLLQVHIAKEETKFGFSETELEDMLREPGLASLNNVRICGLMGMATFTDDTEIVRSEFRYLRGIFEKLKHGYFASRGYFRELSMGMSGDYLIAIEEGSTIVRVGSLIFGER